MPTVTLPDGSTRSYDAPVSPATIAADIGPGLAKAAMLAVEQCYTVEDDVAASEDVTPGED